MHMTQFYPAIVSSKIRIAASKIEAKFPGYLLPRNLLDIDFHLICGMSVLKKNVLTLFRMSIFRASHGWGGGKKPLLS